MKHKKQKKNMDRSVGTGYGILMHRIENTEHTSAAIVVAILILEKITVTTAAHEWKVILNE